MLFFANSFLSGIVLRFDIHVKKSITAGGVDRLAATGLTDTPIEETIVGTVHRLSPVAREITETE